MEAYSSFDIESMPRRESYKLLASLVMPRPIAWVVTQDAQGVNNAAPFSFFNVASADPPLLMISFSAASDRNGKDTLANILQTGEFVVNLVSEELGEAMNQTAVEAPRGVDETQLAGLDLAASIVVKPPRIALSPAAFECTLLQTIEPGPNTTIVLGRILHAHVRRDAFSDESRLHIDSAKLRLIGRMESPSGYCTTRDWFTLERPKWSDRGQD